MLTESPTLRIGSMLRSDGFDWLLAVPSTGLQELYSVYEADNRCVYATREEEAVAIASGLHLGGQSPVVVIQQAGVGNCLNAVLTLADAYDIYFPIIVFDRGSRDPNPVQVVSSIATKKILQTLQCRMVDWRRTDAIDCFRASVAAKARWILCPLAGLA